jgi:hypothetical protein
MECFSMERGVDDGVFIGMKQAHFLLLIGIERAGLGHCL